MTIPTLIVDDEPLGRRMLKTLLRPHADIEVIGTCRGGQAAVQAIRRHAPDLVCLDVEMPEVNGFDVLDALDPQERPPAVIFVTAFDHYALDAFDAEAVDYVTKPVDSQRLATALDRVRTRLHERSAAAMRDALHRLLQTDAEASPAAPDSMRLVVDTGRHKRVLQAETVDYVAAAGDYVEIHADGAVYLMRATMKAMTERLDARRFVRIHRSTIVNLDRIDAMHPRRNGEYTLVLEGGTELRLSRTYRKAFEQRMTGDL
jgi:two-component system LytT family response regulator